MKRKFNKFFQAVRIKWQERDFKHFTSKVQRQYLSRWPSYFTSPKKCCGFCVHLRCASWYKSANTKGIFRCYHCFNVRSWFSCNFICWLSQWINRFSDISFFSKRKLLIKTLSTFSKLESQFRQCKLNRMLILNLYFHLLSGMTWHWAKMYIAKFINLRMVTQIEAIYLAKSMRCENWWILLNNIENLKRLWRWRTWNVNGLKAIEPTSRQHNINQEHQNHKLRFSTKRQYHQKAHHC